ncbi:uncharacterized protein LOC143301316 [Babylonia areolata]|uniref:uncharacterized protein LOC143301316 n=1 Tax=Babylonia areolata TaxID=304850 RepID=UPI003FD3E945
MRLLAASLLVMTVLTARAHHGRMSMPIMPRPRPSPRPMPQDMSMMHDMKPTYVFQVHSDAGMSDVMDSLSDVTVHHSFKVIGEDTYLFVVQCDCHDVDAMSRLAFPEGSTVTQYPVKHLSDVFDKGDGDGMEVEEEALPNMVLSLHVTEFQHRDNMNVEEFKMMMAELGRDYKAMYVNVKPVAYITESTFPPKIMFVTAMGDVEMDVLERGLDIIGGPLRNYITTKGVVAIVGKDD